MTDERQRLGQLHKLAVELRDVLKSVEWGGYGGQRCPACAGFMPDEIGERNKFHNPTCPIAKVLRRAGKLGV